MSILGIARLEFRQLAVGVGLLFGRLAERVVRNAVLGDSGRTGLFGSVEESLETRVGRGLRHLREHLLHDLRFSSVVVFHFLMEEDLPLRKRLFAGESML